MQVLGYVCNELFALRKFYSTRTKQLLDIVVDSLSRVWLFVTPRTAARQASLSITISRSWLELHVQRVGDAIQPSHPLLSPSPAVFSLSQHHGPEKTVFSALCVRCSEYWSFGFTISSADNY